MTRVGDDVLVGAKPRGIRGRPEDLATVLAYHERSKHYPYRYARSLGYMDWATQPDPFRRYTRAPLLPLDLVPPTGSPAYDAAFQPGAIRPASLGRQSISQLFQDALGLSAWKQFGLIDEVDSKIGEGGMGEMYE